jgi:hypothetical protein
MKEIWKDIKGYEGFYRVSNYGRIWSNKSNKTLRCFNDKRGYARLILRKNNQNIGWLVHRLVAIAFIENKHNYLYVNHKDENPRNNKADNLEWCTHQYNCNYGTAIKRRVKNTNYKDIADKNSIEVAQYDLRGNLLRVWKSANDCRRELGFDNSAIAKCCNGEIESSCGFMWKYVYEEAEQSIPAYISGNKKKIIQCYKNGITVKAWNGIREAERALGMSNGLISGCINGKYRTAGGYTWKLGEVSYG